MHLEYMTRSKPKGDSTLGPTSIIDAILARNHSLMAFLLAPYDFICTHFMANYALLNFPP